MPGNGNGNGPVWMNPPGVWAHPAGNEGVIHYNTLQSSEITPSNPPVMAAPPMSAEPSGPPYFSTWSGQYGSSNPEGDKYHRTTPGIDEIRLWWLQANPNYRDNVESYFNNLLFMYPENPYNAYMTFSNWYMGMWGVGTKEKAWSMMVIKKMSEPKEVKKEDLVPFLKQSFYQAFGRRRSIHRVKGEIGLEIETEGRNLFSTPIQYWTATSDGSLRPYKGSPPYEYVLREPLPRKDVGKALTYLVKQQTASKAEVHMSHRCSVHVHVNIQDMKMLEVVNFMTLYYLVEDVLMDFAAPERRGNLFCLRAKDASYQIELLTEAIKSGDWAGLFNTEYRYAAMNASSMGTHGSLEFRTLRGTMDQETIEAWVAILLAMKDKAAGFKSPESISRMFKSMGPKEFLLNVFDERIPMKTLKSWLTDPELGTKTWDGYRAIQDVMFAIDWNKPPAHMDGRAYDMKKSKYQIQLGE